MIWHYLQIAAIVLAVIHTLSLLIQAGRQGELHRIFRRIWNWPMRVSVGGFLLFGLLAWVTTWTIMQSGPLGSYVTSLRTAAWVALGIGIVALFVFLPFFLITISADFQPKQRLPQAVEDIDKVQNLLLEGNCDAAVKIYQQFNKVDTHEAQEAVEAISAALQAGLKV